jgi:hypothetical protein
VALAVNRFVFEGSTRRSAEQLAGIVADAYRDAGWQCSRPNRQEGTQIEGSSA